MAIERTLYNDEDTLAPNAGYPRLEADLRGVARAPADFVRGELPARG